MGLSGGPKTTSVNGAVHLAVGFHASQITNVPVTKITFFAFVTDHGAFITWVHPDGVTEHQIAIVLDVGECAHADLVKKITVVFVCIDNDAGGKAGQPRRWWWCLSWGVLDDFNVSGVVQSGPVLFAEAVHRQLHADLFELWRCEISLS